MKDEFFWLLSKDTDLFALSWLYHFFIWFCPSMSSMSEVYSYWIFYMMFRDGWFADAFRLNDYLIKLIGLFFLLWSSGVCATGYLKFLLPHISLESFRSIC